MTYAMPFQKYVKTVLRVAAPRSTRCITHIVVKQRADEGIGPYDFAWLCLLRQHVLLYSAPDYHTFSKPFTMFSSGSGVQRETITMKMLETMKAGSSS